MIGDAAGLRWADERAARRRPAHRRVRRTTTRRRRPTATRSRSASATALEPLRRRGRAAARRGMAVGTSGTHQRPRAHGGRAARPATCPRARTACASTRERLPRAARPHRAHRRSPSAGACPGSKRSGPSSSPAGSTLLVTALDLFDVDELTDRATGRCAKASCSTRCARHDPDDWSDDPRALRRAAVASLARRCGSDERAHRARRAARAAPVRPDARAARARRPTTARCSSSRRCCTTSASTCRAKGHHRHAAYLVEHARAPRLRARRRSTFLAALVRHHRRGDPKASEAALRRAVDTDDRDRVAQARGAAARRRRPRPRPARRRRGRRRADVGADLVVLRLARARRRRARALGRAPPARPVREGLRPRARVVVALARPRRTSETTSRTGNEICRDRGEDSPADPNVPSWVGHDGSTTLSPTRRELVRATRTPHRRSRGPAGPRAGPERVQHGRAGQGGGRRPRHRLRALPLEAGGARRARVVDRGALGHARSREHGRRRSARERCATCSARCAGTGPSTRRRCASCARSPR